MRSQQAIRMGLLWRIKMSLESDISIPSDLGLNRRSNGIFIYDRKKYL